MKINKLLVILLSWFQESFITGGEIRVITKTAIYVRNKLTVAQCNKYVVPVTNH